MHDAGPLYTALSDACAVLYHSTESTLALAVKLATHSQLTLSYSTDKLKYRALQIAIELIQ